MDLSIFFDPVSSEIVSLSETLSGHQLGSRCGGLSRGFPDWKSAELVILGIPHPEHPTFVGEAIRKQLYPLSLPNEDLALADLGNFRPKDSMEAYEDVIAYVIEELLKEGKTVLLLADGPEYSFAQYKAYESFEKEVNYTFTNSSFALSDPEASLPQHSFLRSIFLHEPNYLFDFTQLGYQRYFVREEELSTLKDMNFSTLRYGELGDKLPEAEPYFREAKLAGFDLSSVRSSECVATLRPSPGGFTAQESCQLARYAGLGSELSSLLVTGLRPELDSHGQGALLAALMCWYFIDGYYQRRPDQPQADRSNLRRYSVKLRAAVGEIIFFESLTTSRWWMEVPYADDIGKPKPRTRLIPCSRKDYETALKDHIPDRWWKLHAKLKWD